MVRIDVPEMNVRIDDLQGLRHDALPWSVQGRWNSGSSDVCSGAPSGAVCMMSAM
jgi:hypothetical protein